MAFYPHLLCRPFEEKAIDRDCFVHPSVSHEILTLAITAIAQYFFMKHLNYIAYDNTLVMMPSSLGQAHI
jgi:hypothetical protein